MHKEVCHYLKDLEQVHPGLRLRRLPQPQRVPEKPEGVHPCVEVSSKFQKLSYL